MRSTIVSSLRWISAAKLLGQILTWAMTLVVIRLLSADDYGLMALAMAFISFGAMFSDLGLGVAIIQAKECPREHIAEVFGMLLLIGVGICLILLALSQPIALFFGEPHLGDVLRALALQFPIGAFSAVPKALLQREMRFKVFSMIEVSTAVVTGVTTFGFALTGHGVWSLVAGSLVGAVWSSVTAYVAAPLLVMPRFAWTNTRRLVSVGGKVTASRMLWYVTTQADVFIVGKLLGKEALGHYSVAFQLASLPMSKLMSIVNQVALPGFARVQDDKDAVVRSVVAGVSLIAFAAFPVFFGMSATADQIVHLVLGDKWSAATLPLQLIPLCMPLRMIASYVSTAVQGIGRPDVDLRNTILTFCVLPPAFYVGCQFGLGGICVAWIVAVPALFLINMKRLLAVTHAGQREVYLAMAAPAVLSIAMMAVIKFVELGTRDAFPLPIQLAVSVVVGGVTYLGGYWLFRRADLRHIWGMVRGHAPSGVAVQQ